MAEIDVWYTIFNHDKPDFDHRFKYEKLHPNDSIFHVMIKIKEVGNNPIADIRDMEVWRFKSLKLDPLGKQMDELLKNVKFTDNASDVELVDLRTKIEDLRLAAYEPLLVRILSKVKRSREDEDDYLTDARRSKLAHIEPSKVDNPSIYESLQGNRNEKILNDCPKRDDILPLSLLYSGFGEFHDFIANPIHSTPSDELETQVDEFVDAMCHLDYEGDKRARTQDIVHRIFAGPQREFKYNIGDGSQASTDGHVTAGHGGPLLILEFKSQVTAAEGQLTSYFLRLAVRSTPAIYYGWRLPALGIIISGTLLSFVGLVMIDKQVRTLNLVDPFICNDSHIRNRARLYTTFAAARRLLVRIEEDAASLVATPPPYITQAHRRLPDIHNLRRVGENGQVEERRIGFQITQELDTGLTGERYLYLATTADLVTTTDQDQTQIVVKFTRTYSKDLHMFCASIQRAPRLFGYEPLPGGWIGIAMEYFPLASRILDSESLLDHGESWKKEIDEVVKKFHDEDYVHGDLRPPNFIVNNSRLLVIDFDWGGKEGTATFPRKRLNEVLRSGRWVKNITKSNDDVVVAHTKRCIDDAMMVQARRTMSS